MQGITSKRYLSIELKRWKRFHRFFYAFYASMGQPIKKLLDLLVSE